jgi:hypothetical protein
MRCLVRGHLAKAGHRILGASVRVRSVASMSSSSVQMIPMIGWVPPMGSWLAIFQACSLFWSTWVVTARAAIGDSVSGPLRSGRKPLTAGKGGAVVGPRFA